MNNTPSMRMARTPSNAPRYDLYWLRHAYLMGAALITSVLSNLGSLEELGSLTGLGSRIGIPWGRGICGGPS